MDRDGRIPCIVGYFDVIGMKGHLAANKPGAVGAMRELAQGAHDYAAAHPDWYDGMYVWNDSVLTVSYFQEGAARRSDAEIIQSCELFKNHLEQCLAANPLKTLYGICVRGEAFPSRLEDVGVAAQPVNLPDSKFTYIKASSLALANIFKVEASLGNNHAEWYVDDRIYRRLPPAAQAVLTRSEVVDLYADPGGRAIHMGTGRLFNNGPARE